MSEVDDIANFLNDRIGAGDVESVRLLIEHYEIDVNIMSSHGWTALTWAAIRQQSNMIRYLIEQGADPAIFYEQTRHPLSLLCDNDKKLDDVKFLVEIVGVDIDQPCCNNESSSFSSAANSNALLVCIVKNSVQIALYLINQGSNLYFIYQRMKPLQHAQAWERLEIATYIQHRV